MSSTASIATENTRLSAALTAGDRRALLGLWALPGVGNGVLDRLRQTVTSRLGELLPLPPRDWTDVLPPTTAAALNGLPRLEALVEQVEARVQAGDMGVAYPGDDRFPALLAQTREAPPLLFYRVLAGVSAKTVRPRVAMVGSRHPEGSFVQRARRFAQQLAEAGVGVVSGAAEGVDRACHLGALDAAGETWAFLGCALDCLDGGQKQLLGHVLEAGGAVFSELPPGIQARAFTFPRRNRLIAGASNVTWVLRAAERSGSLHTAKAARRQGRPLYAMPADSPEVEPTSAGCERLIASGEAQRCPDAETLLRELGIEARRPVPGQESLSESARTVYGLVGRSPTRFEQVLEKASLGAAGLLSALMELELRGLVVQHPGKLYERV